MRRTWVWIKGTLNVEGRPEGYVVRARAQDYRARRRSTGEGRSFPTLEEAKAWLDEPFRLADVEDALDSKRPGRNALHYLPAFMSAASTDPSGSSSVNGASTSATAP